MMNTLTRVCRAAALLVCMVCPVVSADAAATKPVDFAQDVLPVLQRACFECHGAEKQKAGLRLDRAEDALKAGDDRAIVPHRAAESELVRRISLPRGHEDVMPPRGEPLSAQQIQNIRAWIDAGAVWPADVKPAAHWAYVAPQRPELPATSRTDWARNDIDRFVLARLEAAGMQPAPEADKAVLLRRVYLDLIGLPPTPTEVDAFLADTSRDAYEKVVKKLLARPQFGERWARPWLDLARYADSHGFQRDDLRDIWAYRDWVIQALNADMPFTQFTIEQIGGDLLPGATPQQKIATGFNRCTMTNVEAGTEPEETRVNQIFDRVNTIGAVWLGTTLECAQCHDHKYDPISMKDYYRLFAFFNSTALEADRSNPKVPGSIRFLGPSMQIVTDEVRSEQASVEADIKRLDEKLAQRRRQMSGRLPELEAKLRAEAGDAAQEHVLQIAEFAAEQGTTFKLLPDKSALISDDPADKETYIVTVKTDLKNINAIRLEALTHDELPGMGPGVGDANRPNFVLNSFELTAAPADGSSGQAVRFKRAEASFAQKNYDPAGAIDDDAKTAWAINPQFHKSHWAVFHTAEPVGFDGGSVLQFRLVQTFGGGRLIGRLRLSAITGNVSGRSIPAEISRILDRAPSKRTAEQTDKLLDYCLADDEVFSRFKRERELAERRKANLKPASTLVMQELEQPRPSVMFQRGNFLTPGEPVTAGAPAVLHELPKDAPGNRLGLAQWLVDRRNPLTARVVVNRWWAEIFGRGIVSTVEDFGIKGEPPTHPELLDWLAVEFMDGGPRGGWSMKHMLELIVTSATYRQSSKMTSEAIARDDQNKLLARGPRFRMDAEMIRDNALAVSGLLSLKQFGPPIRPPQPDGLWVKVGGQRYEYVVSPGEEKFRRGVYVVIKRGAPYPSFVNFDASARLACTVKRSRSNTPLQALTLLNDPVYVEAAMALARRVLTDLPQGGAEERLRHAFRLCVARDPRPAEVALLRDLLENQRSAAEADKAATKQLLQGEALPAGVSESGFAAWYAVAAALLNLDETITKG